MGQISGGLLALVAVERTDAEPQARWMAAKLATIRAFPDQAGTRAFDRDVRQVGGGVLLVSNFTLAASCDRGRRPSLADAAPPGEAQSTIDLLAGMLREQGVHVELGQFGATMQVELVNDGPVTFLLRTPR